MPAQGTGVRLLDKRGGRIASCGPLLSATGGPDVNVVGGGLPRRARVRAGRSCRKVNAINAVGVEDYVRGVVAKESPASWPPDALRAQAVVARSYALSTSKHGAGFDHYEDTRSQAYGGVAAETAKTNQAVADTAPVSSSTRARSPRPISSPPRGAPPRTTRTPRSASAAPRFPIVRSPTLRRHLPLPPLDQEVLPGLDPGEAGRPGPGQAQEHSRHPDRLLAADRPGEAGRHQQPRCNRADLQALLGLPDSWATFRRVAKRASPGGRAHLLQLDSPLAVGVGLHGIPWSVSRVNS